MTTGTEPAVQVIDLADTPLRELNARLHAADVVPRHWRVVNPGGKHAIAVPWRSRWRGSWATTARA